MVCILLWSSAVRVYDSHAYGKMDVTRERVSRILQLTEIPLSFQIGFNLVNAAVVCAILGFSSILLQVRINAPFQRQQQKVDNFH